MGVFLTSSLAGFEEKVDAGGLVLDGFGTIAVVVHADDITRLFEDFENIHNSGVWEVVEHVGGFVTFEVNGDAEVSALVGEFKVILCGEWVRRKAGHTRSRVMTIIC